MDNNLKISSVFEEDTFIPVLHTCQWKNINPEIRVWNIPADAESLALIMDDPDAPNGTFVHWVAWNIPIGSITEWSSGKGKYMEWINSIWKDSYLWPCSPVWHWIHHYYIQVFALDAMLELDWIVDNERLLKEMEWYVLSEWELVWLYERE